MRLTLHSLSYTAHLLSDWCHLKRHASACTSYEKTSQSTKRIISDVIYATYEQPWRKKKGPGVPWSILESVPWLKYMCVQLSTRIRTINKHPFILVWQRGFQFNITICSNSFSVDVWKSVWIAEWIKIPTALCKSSCGYCCACTGLYEDGFDLGENGHVFPTTLASQLTSSFSFFFFGACCYWVLQMQYKYACTAPRCHDVNVKYSPYRFREIGNRK